MTNPNEFGEFYGTCADCFGKECLEALSEDNLGGTDRDVYRNVRLIARWACPQDPYANNYEAIDSGKTINALASFAIGGREVQL